MKELKTEVGTSVAAAISEFVGKDSGVVIFSAKRYCRGRRSAFRLVSGLVSEESFMVSAVEDWSAHQIPLRSLSHVTLSCFGPCWPLQEDYNIEDVAATVEEKVTSAVERLQMGFPSPYVLCRLPVFGGLSLGPANS